MSDKIATREAYGLALAEFGAQYENIIVLDADLSKSTKTEEFKKKFPERFINMGISESDMMATAAGIATTGKIVFASTFAIFAAGRAFEQVRNSIAYPRLNVKIGATHAGITVGEDGGSHQAVEDIALMRAVPNMVVISPADAVESRAAVKAAIEYDGPVYLRFGRLAVPVIYDKANYVFEMGKGVETAPGNDIAIIATGMMVGSALEARQKLSQEGINARVIDIHTIKPIDKDIIVKAAEETGAVLTVEEHVVNGGLGSAVAEVLSEYRPTIMKRMGLYDQFGQSGKPDDLLKLYKLTPDDIAYEAKALLQRKP
ncbi:transketolase family protein [Mahella australiensis]|uniref:Transketolase subunit B n=1 Tax=Mahella australiensis (strain DSM 15567 / CIP 107919 / 50-1 BON) TaxID=697281 RepID=F4A070_MAHA5|nr:transketolase family protein [Mahella australiensis]AEE96904.1 transketolase subunit B [Mahella australiensis 50-1 BON]